MQNEKKQYEKKSKPQQTQEQKHNEQKEQFDIVDDRNVTADEETVEKQKQKQDQDNWAHLIFFIILIPGVIIVDYVFLIVLVEKEIWSANLIIGIFQLLFFVRIFPSIRLVFRQIVSAIGRRNI